MVTGLLPEDRYDIYEHFQNLFQNDYYFKQNGITKKCRS